MLYVGCVTETPFRPKQGPLNNLAPNLGLMPLCHASVLVLFLKLSLYYYDYIIIIVIVVVVIIDIVIVVVVVVALIFRIATILY